MADITMEQDWEDSFPFLTDDSRIEAVFLFALQHATSKRHLDKMLTEWFPAAWRLNREDRHVLKCFWEEWYKPGAPKRSCNDHIARQSLKRMMGTHSLRKYYLRLIHDWFDVHKLASSVWKSGTFTRIKRGVGAQKVMFLVDMHKNLFPLFTKRYERDGEVHWFAYLGFSGWTGLTEEGVFKLLEQEGFDGRTDQDLNNFTLALKLDAEPLEKLIWSQTLGEITANPADHRIAIFADAGFDEELTNQAMTRIKGSFIERQYHHTAPR